MKFTSYLSKKTLNTALKVSNLVWIRYHPNIYTSWLTFHNFLLVIERNVFAAYEALYLSMTLSVKKLLSRL